MNFLGAYTCCPFDKSHRIQNGRLQKHLFKCRKNYPKTTKVTCPFNAIHILDPQEYEHHLSVCPSSGNVKCYQHLLEPQVQVGTISLENVCNLQNTTLDEDWSGNHPTYDPFVASENKNVIRTAVGLSKAKKKQFKQRERERLAALENYNSSNIESAKQKSAKLEKPLRAPKKAAEAISSDLKSDTITNKICSDDLISKLKEVSIEENKDNAWSKKDSQESILNNTFNKKTNRLIISKKIFQSEDTKNILQEAIDTSIIQQNSFETEVNTSGTEYSLNMKKRSTFCGEAKKISTGRGFTIAHEHLRSKLTKKKESVEDFSTIYDSDENVNNIIDINLQKKSS